MKRTALPVRLVAALTRSKAKLLRRKYYQTIPLSLQSVISGEAHGASGAFERDYQAVRRAAAGCAR